MPQVFIEFGYVWSHEDHGFYGSDNPELYLSDGDGGTVYALKEYGSAGTYVGGWNGTWDHWDYYERTIVAIHVGYIPEDVAEFYGPHEFTLNGAFKYWQDTMSETELDAFVAANAALYPIHYEAPDDVIDDYADDISTEGEVAVGGKINGNNETPDDLDYFRVWLIEGNTYQFDMEGSETGKGTLSDPLLAITSLGGALLTHDDDGGAGYNSRIEDFTAGYTGYHYLVAFPAVDNLSGTYEISAQVTSIGDDWGEGWGTNGKIRQGPSNSLVSDKYKKKGYLGDSEVDSFEVTFVAGFNYDIFVEGLPNPENGKALVDFEVSIKLLGYSDTITLVSSEIGDTGVWRSNPFMQMGDSFPAGLVPGEQVQALITITGLNHVNAQNVGGYKVWVAGEDDHGDNRLTNSTLHKGLRVTGHLQDRDKNAPSGASPFGDEDWFKIEGGLKAGKLYVVSFDPTDDATTFLNASLFSPIAVQDFSNSDFIYESLVDTPDAWVSVEASNLTSGDRSFELTVFEVDKTLIGSGSGEKLQGSKKDDYVKAGGGKDRLIGRKGDDVLFGEAGNDTLLGGGGKDVLVGGRGKDKLKGNGGQDRFHFEHQFGKDQILDFQNDVDTIVLDSTLWTGTKSIAKILNKFGEANNGNFVLDFGSGDVLTILNTTKGELKNDIEII